MSAVLVGSIAVAAIKEIGIPLFKHKILPFLVRAADKLIGSGKGEVKSAVVSDASIAFLNALCGGNADLSSLPGDIKQAWQDAQNENALVGHATKLDVKADGDVITGLSEILSGVHHLLKARA